MGRHATLLAGVVAIGLWASAAPTAERAPIVGRVTQVRDGDTIEVEGQPIWLQGLTAPELRQPMGRKPGATCAA